MGVMNIDKAEVACRFGRSIESYEEHAAVQREIAAHLAELATAYVTQPPRKILEVGCGTGLLTERILQLWAGSELWVNDLVEGMCAKAAARCRVPAAHCLVGDIESLPLPGAFDLVISASVFQWLARPAETFIRLAACLQPGGWLAFSTFGEDNCHELREVAGTGLAYPSADELRAMLSPHFRIVHTEEARYCLDFSDPVQILHHVKRTGVNASASRTLWTRSKLQAFSDRYARLFARDGIFPLTYHPRYVLCQKPE